MDARQYIRVTRILAKQGRKAYPVYVGLTKVGDVTDQGDCQNLTFPRDNRRILVSLMANASIRDKSSRQILANAARKFRLGEW